MYFIRLSNIVVVVGGRKIGNTKNSDGHDNFFSDTYLLNAETLEWSILEFTGPPLIGIYNFASCLTDEGGLYIFGGTEDPHQLNKNLYRIKEVTSVEAKIHSLQIERSEMPAKKNKSPTIRFSN